METSGLQAQYGSHSAGAVNAITKSGTNDFHGSLFEFVRNGSLNARNAFAVTNDGLKRNQFGGTIGGPIHLKMYDGRNRSFFFTTFEKTRAREQTSTAFRTLPTREFQNGDFSRLFDPAYTGDARSGTVIGTDALGRPVRFGQIYDPRTTRVVDGRVVRDPFPNNQIPRALWDAVARNTLEQDLWDIPPLERLFNNQPTIATCCPVFDQNTYAIKYDQVISNAHRMSIYVNREWRERNNSAGGRYGPPPGKPTNLYQLQKTPSWMIRASENWVISDRLLHRFAFGYNRFGNANRSVYFNAGWPSKIGLTNQPDTTFPRFDFRSGAAILGGWGSTGIFGSISRGASYEGSTIVQDDLTFVTGKHSIKAGFEGGQMPLQRRLPKRGFTPLDKKVYALVNLRDLELFEAGSVVDIEALGKAGLVKALGDGVKILGDGDLTKALTVKAHKFSKSAVAKIEAAGGKVEVI